MLLAQIYYTSWKITPCEYYFNQIEIHFEVLILTKKLQLKNSFKM
jgi:hypothetical protein